MSTPNASMLIGSILCRSSAGDHSCRELMCATVLSYPEDTVPLRSSLTSGSP